MRGGSGEGKYYGYQSSRKMYSDALLSPALIIFLMDFHDWCLSKLGYHNLSPHISMLKKSLFISSLHSGWKYWENVQKGANKILIFFENFDTLTAHIAVLCQFAYDPVVIIFKTENIIMVQKIHTHIAVIFSMILKHCVTSLNHTHDHSLCFWRELLLQRALSYLLNKSSLSKETLDFWKCSSTFTTVCTVRLELSFAFICALLKGEGVTRSFPTLIVWVKKKSTKSDFFCQILVKSRNVQIDKQSQNWKCIRYMKPNLFVSMK